MKKLFLFSCLILSPYLLAKVTVIHNVNGYTINNHQLTKFEAIAFESGRVLDIGSNSEIKQKHVNNKTTQVIDGKGKTMLPGLHDSSVDLLYAAQLAVKIDLRNTTSLKEVLQKIKEYSDNDPEGLYVIGYGWNHEKWQDKKLPTRELLDQLEIDKYIWLLSENRQMGWANSKLINVAKAEKGNKSKYGNNIIYTKEGNHSGIYIENALGIIQRHIVRLTTTEYYLALIDILNDFAKLGVTSIDNTSSETKTIRRLSKIANAGKLPIHVNATITSADKGLQTMLEDGAYHNENQLLHVHSVRFYIDGDFDKEKAYLKKPYSNNKNNFGINMQPQHFILQQMKKLTNDDWSVTLQAYGDKANKIALDLITNANHKTKQMRHRVDNATLIDTKDISRYKDSGAFVAIQPYKAIKELPYLQTIIGKQRAKSTHRWKSLSNYGVKLISGSGYPHHSANPFEGMQASITRKIDNSTPLNTSEALNRQQAFASYSINAAYANRQEDSLGSLEKEKWADFILIDQDIFKVKVTDINKTQVLQTWVAGKKIYDSLEK